MSDNFSVSDRTAPAVIGLIPVHVTLELIEVHNGATAIARSYMERDGRRIIRVGLCKSHLLVSKALARATLSGCAVAGRVLSVLGECNRRQGHHASAAAHGRLRSAGTKLGEWLRKPLGGF